MKSRPVEANPSPSAEAFKQARFCIDSAGRGSKSHFTRKIGEWLSHLYDCAMGTQYLGRFIASLFRYYRRDENAEAHGILPAV